MSSNILFERDILYSTDCGGNPGSVHIQVLEPDQNNRIPVVIEARTEHSPLENIDAIVRVIQSDIFNRLSIDTTKNTDIYIKATPEIEAECGSHSHLKLTLLDEGVKYEGVNR